MPHREADIPKRPFEAANLLISFAKLKEIATFLGQHETMKKIIYAVSIFATLGRAANAQDATYAAKMREVNAAAPLPDQHDVEADALKTLQAIATQKSQCVPTGVRMEKPTPATAWTDAGKA